MHMQYSGENYVSVAKTGFLSQITPKWVLKFRIQKKLLTIYYIIKMFVLLIKYIKEGLNHISSHVAYFTPTDLNF